MSPETQPQRILIVLPDGFEILEAAAFIDVFGWAQQYGSVPIEAVTAGIGSKTRCTFHSLTVEPQIRLSEVDPNDFDAICLPGGFGSWNFYEEAYSSPLLDLLAEFDRKEKPVASICVGALPLGKSGLLRGRAATTYSFRDSPRREQLEAFGVRLGSEPIVVDGNVITSESPATAVEVALRLLARLTGEANAAEIRAMMGFGPDPRVRQES